MNQPHPQGDEEIHDVKNLKKASKWKKEQRNLNKALRFGSGNPPLHTGLYDNKTEGAQDNFEMTQSHRFDWLKYPTATNTNTERGGI